MSPKASSKVDGVPLSQAYTLVATEPELSEFESLVSRGFWPRFVFTLGGWETENDRLASRAATIKEGFDAAVLDQLRLGVLVAIARDTRLPITAGPQKIPANAWNYISVDFHGEKATADGHDLLDVRIRYANPRTGTKLLERNLGFWIRSLVAERPEKLIKETVWTLALERFVEVPVRVFERAWSDNTPDSWRKQGRPRKTPR